MMSQGLDDEIHAEIEMEDPERVAEAILALWRLDASAVWSVRETTRIRLRCARSSFVWSVRALEAEGIRVRRASIVEASA